MAHSATSSPGDMRRYSGSAQIVSYLALSTALRSGALSSAGASGFAGGDRRGLCGVGDDRPAFAASKCAFPKFLLHLSELATTDRLLRSRQRCAFTNAHQPSVRFFSNNGLLTPDRAAVRVNIERLLSARPRLDGWRARFFGVVGAGARRTPPVPVPGAGPVFRPAPPSFSGTPSGLVRLRSATYFC